MKTNESAILSSLLAAVAIVGLAAGCSTTSTGNPSSAGAPSPARDSGKGGAQLWGENCGRCHNIPSPSTYSSAEWDIIMLHMRFRANLTAEQHQKILAFMKSSK